VVPFNLNALEYQLLVLYENSVMCICNGNFFIIQIINSSRDITPETEDPG